MIFRVIDPKTGNEPIFDGNHICKEKWFKESGLIPFDLDVFAITENGNLILIDDCNNIAYVPNGRFDVVVAEDIKERLRQYIIPFRGYCPAKDKGEVSYKARSTLFSINGKPVYFCQGYIDRMTDELLDTCRECKRNVINADEYIWE